MSQRNQKLKILYLMKIFLEETDEKHPLSIQELISKLDLHGISAERKSLYADIETLRQFGLDLLMDKGKTTGYYLASRDFELAELKLLVDTIQSARFLTKKKSKELIEKIKKLTDQHNAQNLQRQVYVANRLKSINESIYYNVDTLHEAIAKGRKVSFQYFDYDMEKKKVYRKEGKRYIISPYSLLWDDENYYVIAYYEKHHHFVHYRVDRMASVEVSTEQREELKEGTYFDVAEYAKKTFSMFGGEDQRVKLLFEEELVNQVLDRFGNEVNFQVESPKSFSIRVQVKVSSTFYAWVAQYEGKVQILEPPIVQEGYVSFLKNLLQSITEPKV